MQSRMPVWNAVLVSSGGLAGAIGVALSALAAHEGGAGLAIPASFLLMHAPALLGIGYLASGRVARGGGLLLLVGLVLFCGDLVARHALGTRLFPYAAPGGGLALIGGWLVVAISPWLRGR